MPTQWWTFHVISRTVRELDVMGILL